MCVCGSYIDSTYLFTAGATPSWPPRWSSGAPASRRCRACSLFKLAICFAVSKYDNISDARFRWHVRRTVTQRNCGFPLFHSSWSHLSLSAYSLREAYATSSRGSKQPLALSRTYRPHTTRCILYPRGSSLSYRPVAHIGLFLSQALTPRFYTVEIPFLSSSSQRRPEACPRSNCRQLSAFPRISSCPAIQASGASQAGAASPPPHERHARLGASHGFVGCVSLRSIDPRALPLPRLRGHATVPASSLFLFLTTSRHGARTLQSPGQAAC